MGSGSADIRDGCWLSTFLCRPANSNLWEDCIGESESKTYVDNPFKIYILCLCYTKWGNHFRAFDKVKMIYWWTWWRSFMLLWTFSGSLPISLQLRSKGFVEKPASSGFNQALWQPQEWSQWYQGPQVVRHHWLDRHLPEKGKIPVWNTRRRI